MFILLLLFFKSICLFCQRLVLHIHDRWINPKNVRLFKEAVETKGTKVAIEEYRQQGKPKPKRRRYASSSTSNSSTLSHSLADSENCRFCANTPQGYCRHHFHLQELQVQKQQQQKNWCSLAGGFNIPNRSTERRQLRKIKRELKQNIQQQQQKSSKSSTTYNSSAIYDYNNTSYNSAYSPPAAASYESNSINSSFNDSGYQSVSVTASASSTLDSEHSGLLASEQTSEISSIISAFPPSSSSLPSAADYVEIELPTAPSSPSIVETTYSFETCCESPPPHSSSPNLAKTTSFNSFMSCEYSAISTSYL